jgi:hypothetical protein
MQTNTALKQHDLAAKLDRLTYRILIGPAAGALSRVPRSSIRQNLPSIYSHVVLPPDTKMNISTVGRHL